MFRKWNFEDVLTPAERFQEKSRAANFIHDPAQTIAVECLQTVFDALLSSPVRYSPWRRFLHKLSPSYSPLLPVTGLYMWGGVGRGKTFLMDLFYEALPFQNKLRSHFHRFMHSVHGQLRQMKEQVDPLERVADDLASRTRIICFDEFFVSDIADAMILGNLFDGLFRRGVSLVATSNVHPDDLYKSGLQRNRFLPVIEQLKFHTKVLHVDGPTDYRLQFLEKTEIYHSPLDRKADENLDRYFDEIAPDAGTRNQVLEIEGRDILTVRHADGVVWFDFPQICDGPRSQNDYIEISRCYQTVLISNVPRFTVREENQARRFIALVDEFYDRKVKLILSAATPLGSLYDGEHLRMEFLRTHSRLEEMQSHDYLASSHLP